MPQELPGGNHSHPSAAERALGELDLERLGLAVAVDLDVGGLAGLEAGDRAREIVRARDRFVTELRDDVAAARELGALEDLAPAAAADAGLRRRTARRHLLHPDALFDVQPEVLDELRVEPDRGHAEVG